MTSRTELEPTGADALFTDVLKLNAVATQTLKVSALLWFLVAVAGQWIFLLYVAAYYVSPTLQGGLEALANTHLPKSYIPGDTLGNIAVTAHLFLAVGIIFCGPLQLIPQIRSHFPVFHRWNGRVFMLSVFVASISGLYMVWVRGSVGDFGQHIGLSLNAVLIMVFAAMALRYAIAREIDTHRHWALRLFLAANGVWFARIGLWLWVYLTGGMGIDFKTFTGPFLTFLNFAQYLLPLAVLELYLHTKNRAGVCGRLSMTAFLFVLTTLMGFGIYQASINLWLPRLQ